MQAETTGRVLFDGELLADYFQIYLHDESDPVLPDDYSEDSIGRRIMAGPHAIILHTQRNMDVPLRVEWHDGRPDITLAEHQHVTQAGFIAPTGRLLLAGLTDDIATAPRFTVPAGPIGVIATLDGLDTLDETGLEGDDRYALHLWPGTVEGVTVLRHYEGGA